MQILIYILRAFVVVFGITAPRPDQERRAALLLAAVLGGLALFLVGASLLILTGVGMSVAR